MQNPNKDVAYVNNLISMVISSVSAMEMATDELIPRTGKYKKLVDFLNESDSQSIGFFIGVLATTVTINANLTTQVEECKVRDFLEKKKALIFGEGLKPEKEDQPNDTAFAQYQILSRLMSRSKNFTAHLRSQKGNKFSLN